MPEPALRRTRALLGGLVLVVSLLMAAPAEAAGADCGGGDIELLQHERHLSTIVGARVSGIGPSCDGQPVGVQFLGNDAGDPALPAAELAHAYSDEDSCTGREEPQGVLRDGTVEVLLCEGSATSGHVDGEHLTQLRLITPAGTTTVDPGPSDDPPPAPADPDPAPDPEPGGDLPMTGADVLRAVLLGAVLVVAGGGLLRVSRLGRHVRAR